MRKTYLLPVETPDGRVELEIQHSVENLNEPDMHVKLTVNIQETEMAFESSETEDALIRLARALPEGWRIRSCLSCRYGHFCPVGDYDNEVFCVTDFEPKQARDLWHVTEDPVEREKRSRTLFDTCGGFMPESEDYYTYSDYYRRVMK